MVALEHLYREWLEAGRRYDESLRRSEELIEAGQEVPAHLLADLKKLEADMKTKLLVFAEASKPDN